jgi:hypothetical protein
LDHDSPFMLPATARVTCACHHPAFSIEMGVSQILPRLACNCTPISASCRPRMTGAGHRQLLVEMGSQTFCPGWPQTMILPFSASPVKQDSRHEPLAPVF